MHDALTDEERQYAGWVRELAADVFAPLAANGKPGRVNRPLVAALGEHGLLRRMFPRTEQTAPEPALFEAIPSQLTPSAATPPGQTSSTQARAVDLCLLREALARESTDAETALALQGLGAYPILQSGRPELVKTWIPRVAGGEAVAAFALSEAEAGSDAGALQLQAVRDGDGWRLTGEKLWISNAPDADIYTVFARTTEGAGARGVTAFAVDGHSPGISGEPIELVAEHPVGRLRLDGVHVPDHNVLGEVDRGFRVAMGTLDLFRPSVGAFGVGMAQAALDAAVRYAGERSAFGGPLRELQSVSHKLAEMATRTEAARLLVYSAAYAYDSGADDVTKRSAMAKLLATETAQYVVDAAIQIHGARALQRGHPLEHLYREVRAPRIYEGASEVQRTVIGRELYR